MKNSFMQYEYSITQILLRFFSLPAIILVVYIVHKGIRLTWGIYALFGIYVLAGIVALLLLPRLSARIYVDETGMVAKSLGKERWRCRWREIKDLQINRAVRNPSNFLIWFNSEGVEEKQLIQITSRSKKILSYYCSVKAYKEIFESGKMVSQSAEAGEKLEQ